MKTTLFKRPWQGCGTTALGYAVMAAGLLATANLTAAPSVTTLTQIPYFSYPNYYGSTNTDGNTLYAQFHTPIGLAIDSSGNYLYVADRDNNAIRELKLQLNQTLTFVPNSYVPANLIQHPVGVAVDGSRNVYVLNRGTTNNVSTNGTVLEFNQYGDLIATNATGLTNAAGIALDRAGNIYVTVNSNMLIQITPGGVRTTIATIAIAGTSLKGIVVKQDGRIAACDYGRNGILLIDPASGIITTNTGFNGAGDYTGLNNQGATPAYAMFNQPYGVAEVGDGGLIVTDYGNHKVKVINSSGITTNLYGVSSNYWVQPLNRSKNIFPGWYDGTVTNVEVVGTVEARWPAGVTFSCNGTVYTTEDYYHLIRKVEFTGLPLPPPPPPAVPDPQIGYVTFPPDDFTSVFHGGAGISNSFVFNNDVSMVIVGTNGSQTFYTYGNTPPTGSIPDPTSSSISAPPGYVDGLYSNQVVGVYTVAEILPDLTIKAIGVKDDGSPNSHIVQARFQFKTANPLIIGDNASLFTISDITDGAVFWYTIDGSNPTNTLPSLLLCTNSPSHTNTIILSISSNFTLRVRAFRDNYQPSAIMSAFFAASNFVPNTISFGFASGEASSDFVASPGQYFYAPVTLSVLPDQTIYSLQFNITVTNGVTAVTNYSLSPAITPNAFGFESMLMKPIPGVTPVTYTPIPPYMFVANVGSPQPTTNSVLYEGSWFESLVFTDTTNNLLGVGWLERAGKTNLYDTVKQDLITFSMAHDIVHLSEDGQIEVGGYAFLVPVNAAPTNAYQIQIGRPSATSDGIGAPGSSVFIYAPTNGSLGGGAANSIKIVTMGQLKYLVGNVYPFRWFNAGDFGNNNLQNPDVMQVFQSAIYSLNYPPFDPNSWNGSGFTNVSDFFDAMDSCGNFGVDNGSGVYTNAGAYSAIFPTTVNYTITNFSYFLDTNDVVTNFSSTNIGYTTNITVNINFFTAISTNTYFYPTTTNEVLVVNTFYFFNQLNRLFDGNDLTINTNMFGDGVLDVCDVYVTFRRSLDPSLTWFQRFWTNGFRVAEITLNAFTNHVLIQPLSSSRKLQPAIVAGTAQPKVNFTCGDITNASPGQIVSVPITAKILGDYPLRVLMLNLTVVPLDGSPALTTQVQFTPSAALGAPTSGFTASDGGPANYAAAWLNSTIAGLTGDAIIGTLTVTIPANATSSSAYAIHFDHASASPNGIASFPKQTLTGLITLSSRANSSYNDGIPDSWRLRYFGTVNNMLSVTNADADGDGMNNLQECLAGTDPVDPTSFFKNISIDPAAAQQPQDCVISWPSVSGKQYVIERSTSLFPPNWTPVSTNNGTGTTMEFHDVSGGGVRFYRVRVQ